MLYVGIGEGGGKLIADVRRSRVLSVRQAVRRVADSRVLIAVVAVVVLQ